MNPVGNILCIEDTDRTHYPFLRQWLGMEIDIHNQWSLNNGTLGLELNIDNNGKHKMSYMVRVKMKEAKILVESAYRTIAICDDRKRILLPLVLPMINDLVMFYKLKIERDDYIKKNYLSPKNWSIE